MRSHGHEIDIQVVDSLQNFPDRPLVGGHIEGYSQSGIGKRNAVLLQFGLDRSFLFGVFGMLEFIMKQHDFGVVHPREALDAA